MVQAFIFDLDETLIDRTATIKLFIKDQFVRLGLDKQYTYGAYQSRFLELDQNGYADKEQLFQTLIEEFNISWSVESLIADFYDNAWKNCQTFVDVEDTLNQLKRQGYKLGIITNGSSRSQRAKISGTDLSNWMETILVSGEEGISKPDAEIYLRALQRLNIDAEHCVFIGDNPQTDIAGAYNVGITSVWVKRHRPWPDNLSFSPDHTISEIAELLSIQF